MPWRLGAAFALLSLGSALGVTVETAAPAAAASDPVIAAAGDIACSFADGNFNSGTGTATNCRQAATSNLIKSRNVTAVLPLGDQQYWTGTTNEYKGGYDPSWGQLKSITRPVPGNHDYETAGATGYYGYFGSAAGDPAKGWYSYDIGTWHVVAVNSNCTVVDCTAGSPQEQWLKNDLSAHTNRCTLVYWHHPRFSSGNLGNDDNLVPFWNDLYAAGVELVLDGHHHIYERFAPQKPDTTVDNVRGVRQITVGTGGYNHDQTLRSPVQANSQVLDNTTFGVLFLTLHPTGYDFEFANDGSGSLTDSGSGTCKGVPGAPSAVAAAPKNNAADVSWTAAKDDGGLPITGYQVTASPGGKSVTVGPNVTGATVPGLNNGASYTFSVQAINDIGPGVAASTAPVVPGTGGYWLVASDGGIFSYGTARFFGSTGGMKLNQPIVGMASTPSHNGYWLVASDGGIFSYGDAKFFGSTGGTRLNQPVVGMAPTPSGQGYWLVARDGGIFSYGDAKFFGSTGGTRLNQPIVGMASTPSGKGYWLVASDGGIFSYGDAGFLGSTGAMKLNQPIVGMGSSPSGKGYWLVARDGGIFSYGDSKFYGSTGGTKLNQPIVGMAPTATGVGYWLVASDGGIFSYGDAKFFGSTGGQKLNQPVIGSAAS
jgi:hypothetical protein